MEQDRLEVLVEDLRDNVGRIFESHKLLHRKLDRWIANSEKLGSVSADLEAHRNDTERHRGYMVAEHPSPPGQH